MNRLVVRTLRTGQVVVRRLDQTSVTPDLVGGRQKSLQYGPC